MEKILVVEDNTSMRIEICDILKMENFEVFNASDGLLALEIAKQKLPDLIISDIMMPILDGYQLYEELNKEPLTQDIPFIFITALADTEYIRKGMNLGADDYLTKPVSAINLVKTVKKRIEKSEKYHSQINQLRKNVSYFLPNELRTPLNRIIGFSEYLLKEINNVPKSEIIMVLQSILKSGKSLEPITGNYLIFSRLFLQSKNPDFLKHFSKGPLIKTKKNIEEIAVKIGNETHRLNDMSFHLLETNLNIYKEYFDKIVEGLVLNAIKFSITGNKIKITSVSRDGKYYFSVENEGNSMDKEHIDNLDEFIHFDQMSFEQKGMGLGLAIVKKITEIYRGKFEINSKPAQFLNCTVCFDLN